MLYLTIAGAVQVSGFLLRVIFRFGDSLAARNTQHAGIAGPLGTMYKKEIMTKIILTFILFGNLLISCGQEKQNCKLLEMDTLFSFDRIGPVRIGDNLTETVEKFNFQLVDNYFESYCNNEVIMRLWIKNDSLVSGIEVLSMNFKTSEGVHVGMSVDEFLSIFPKQKMGFNQYEEEYFVIEKYTKERQRMLLAYISSEKQLGINYQFMETFEYDTDGVIVRIELFDW